MIDFILCGEKLSFDEERLTVDEARQLKRATGLTVRGFLTGLREYDVDSVVALVWLTRHRGGDPVPWEAISFDLFADLEIIRDEDEDTDAGPPPVGEASTSTSTSTTPPPTRSTRTSTGRTGSARSRSGSGTPPPRLTP